MADDNEEKSTTEQVLAIASQVVLFLLMFGFAATIHYKTFFRSLKSSGIFIGLALQLVVMPLIGYGIINLVELNNTSVIVFMILLSSPGGALSNFFNSIFNGDLSLSIAMTTVSTLVSMAFLPFNLYFYLNVLSSNQESVTDDLDWAVLGQTVSILLAGVLLGLYSNYKFPQHIERIYKLANFCALFQIVLAFANSNNDSPIWEKPPEIFAITFIASGTALILSLMVGLAIDMERPALFSVVIEVAVQNSSVAVAFAFAAFSGDDLSQALSIPVSHGVATTLYCCIFSAWAYRNGWTYSPQHATLWESMVGFHQPHPEDFADEPGHHSQMRKDSVDLDEDVKDVKAVKAETELDDPDPEA